MFDEAVSSVLTLHLQILTIHTLDNGSLESKKEGKRVLEQCVFG